MTFTIGIPVHNGARYVGEALRSALSQVRSANEVLVIDDASTDGSKAILESDEFKHKIKLLHHESPTGFVDAWNRVIRNSTFDFVTLLHQDDLLHEGYLQAVELALRSFPLARHVYSGYYLIDRSGMRIGASPTPHSSVAALYSGKEYAHNYLASVSRNMHIHRCPGVTTERKLLLTECTYRSEAGQIADDDFFIRVGKFTDVVGISEPLASFRIHPESATESNRSLSLKLAHDYLFSSQFHVDHPEYLDALDRQVIFRLCAKFITSVLFQSFSTENEEWMHSAKYMADKFSRIQAEWELKYLPLWSRILWMLKKKNIHATKLYVEGVSLLMRLRSVFRSLWRRNVGSEL